jgi:hypothetical protein
MILDVANEYLPIEINKAQSVLFPEKNYNRWLEHPTSNIVHHDSICCEQARLWFLSYARSMQGWSTSQFQLNAPTWLSELFEWGPSLWPISWCELVKEKTLDCGVFAALSREVFLAQGHQVHPAQCLLIYSTSCTDHWKELWHRKMPVNKKKEACEVFPWIGDQVVYHEVCIVEPNYSDTNQMAKVYDSTFGNWYEPIRREGFGALLSIRSECPRLLNWGNKVLSHGEWVDL